MDGISVAGEVAGAATALAGLILVYLGSITASYGSYDFTQQGAVRASHKRRAWIAFCGLIVALTSAASAILAKWLPCESLADAAVIMLFIAFLAGIGSALLSVLEVR